MHTEKRKGQTDPRGARGGEASEAPRRPATVQRLFSATFQVSRAVSRTAYIVSSVYETRFKPFTLAFTLLTPLRLRSLRMPLAAFLATTPRRPPPPRHRDQRASPRVKGRILLLLLLSLFLSFHANPSPLSLNPRYPRADHLGNLSSCVDDIADPDRAWEPNDLSRDVEYVDISRGGDRSLPHASGSVVLFPAVSRNPRDPSITNALKDALSRLMEFRGNTCCARGGLCVATITADSVCVSRKSTQ